MTNLRAMKNLNNTNLTHLNMIFKYQNNLKNYNHHILLSQFKRILLFKQVIKFQKNNPTYPSNQLSQLNSIDNLLIYLYLFHEKLKNLLDLLKYTQSINNSKFNIHLLKKQNHYELSHHLNNLIDLLHLILNKV